GGMRDFHVTGVQTCALPICFITDQHCHAQNKMRMIWDAGYDRIAIAYSDSRADLPLLRAADAPVVVNPKQSAVATFRQVLPRGRSEERRVGWWWRTGGRPRA